MYDVQITMWLCQRVTWWLKAELNRSGGPLVIRIS